MEVRTRQSDHGTEITVHTDSRVALSVRSNGEERIYLPGIDADGSSYYGGSSEGLIRTSEGYKVVHEGEVDSLEVIG